MLRNPRPAPSKSVDTGSSGFLKIHANRELWLHNPAVTQLGWLTRSPVTGREVAPEQMTSAKSSFPPSLGRRSGWAARLRELNLLALGGWGRQGQGYYWFLQSFVPLQGDKMDPQHQHKAKSLSRLNINSFVYFLLRISPWFPCSIHCVFLGCLPS